MFEISTSKLFFALWPDPAMATELHSLAQAIKTIESERVIAPQMIHLTLRYIGNVETETLVCLTRMAQNVVINKFAISLQNLGYWKKPGVIWSSPKNWPGTLSQLVLTLEQGCTQCGIDVEKRPYSPHVTLIRKARKLTSVSLKMQTPLLWSVTDFVLVESKSTNEGVVYQVLNRWRLI